MPELPEVETIKQALNQYVVGKVIKNAKIRKAKLVSPWPAKFRRQLIGKEIKKVSRRAKMLVILISVLVEKDTKNEIVFRLDKFIDFTL